MEKIDPFLSSICDKLSILLGIGNTLCVFDPVVKTEAQCIGRSIPMNSQELLPMTNVVWMSLTRWAAPPYLLDGRLRPNFRTDARLHPFNH